MNLISARRRGVAAPALRLAQLGLPGSGDCMNILRRSSRWRARSGAAGPRLKPPPGLPPPDRWPPEGGDVPDPPGGEDPWPS